MRRVLVFGNSGSGKSTLAAQLCRSEGLAHLDLDTIAWQPGSPPRRRELAASEADIRAFQAQHCAWVIEGCYADLLELAMTGATEVIFLDLPVDRCIANARRRPWEPHKYESREAQDANLAMLLQWIEQYPERRDTFSRSAHLTLYDSFEGEKSIRTENLGPG